MLDSIDFVQSDLDLHLGRLGICTNCCKGALTLSVLPILRENAFKILWEKEKMMVISIFSFCFPKFSTFNLSPHMPILGFSNSAANIMSKILTNGDTIF